MLDKVPPHSIEAEQAVLASMMVSSGVVELIRDSLTPASFYQHTHGKLYQAILDVYKAGRTPDTINLRDHLQATGELEAAGGYGYLIDLAGSIPSIHLAEEYAKTVAERAGMRELIRAGSEIVTLGFDGTRPTEELVGLAQAKLSKVDTGTASRVIYSAGEVARMFYDNISARADNRLDPSLESISTGYYDLDHIIEFDPQDLLILAARPGMGKTSLALGLTTSIAQNHPTFFSTMEMSKEQLMNRMVASAADVDSNALKRGDLTDAEWKKVVSAVEWIDGLNLQIDERAALTIGQLRSACRQAKLAMGGLRFIVVDYLQLMTPDNLKASRNDAIGQISNGLKGLAKEFGCPVLALSQLSRALESRDDKRPMLSDLRDSGAIEQDADAVLFIYRPEYYFRGDPAKGEYPEKPGLAEVIVAKHRKGATGTADLYFDKTRTKFENLDYERKVALASQTKRA